MAKIVIIDDDDSMRVMLAQMVEWLGHEVFAEPDGRAGLKRIQECSPDLVITDMIMPEKEGVETIMDIRRSFKGTRIIAMSGGGRNSGADYLKIARQLGANCTLDKPFSREELKAALAKALS